MFRVYLALFMCVVYQSIYAQIIVSADTVKFGTVDKGDFMSKSLIVQNNFDEEVEVQFEQTHPDFSPSQSIIVLSAKSAKGIEILFYPRHNVRYDAELLVRTSSRSGSFSVHLSGDGNYIDTYYATTQNLWEEDLKKELKSIVSKNYVNLGYNGARDKMYDEIDNQNGKVTCVYTGRTATFNTRAGANDNSFNCEHSWPQSLFNSNEPEKADIHHLYPTDVGANSVRANYPFGNVNTATWSTGGSRYGNSTFEPRDLHKGDVARSIFYFATRYTNYSNFLNNQESELRQWARNFPPDSNSINRNNTIYNYQKNRNPYVDHPEFLERITSISTESKAALFVDVIISAEEINLGSYPSNPNIKYRLVLVNKGNKSLYYSGISHDKNEFQLDTDTFTLSPGIPKTILIDLVPVTNLGVVTDSLRFNTDDVKFKFVIPIEVDVKSLSSGKPKTMNPTFLVQGNRLIIRSGLGSKCAVYGLNGQILVLNEISSSFTELDMGNLPAGIYFAVLTESNGAQQIKKLHIRP